MDVSNLLQNKREEVLQAFGKTEKQLQRDIAAVRTWLNQQPHLPEMPEDAIIENFLITNKFSIENTKNKLDMYYSIRTMIPECFENKNPKLRHMQDITEVVYYIPLPKLTKELYRVNIAKIIGDPKQFNVYNFFAHQININEVRLHEEITLGDVLVLDLKDVSLSHLVKVTPVHIKKAVLVLENVFSNRIKQIHLLNSSTCVDALVGLLKSVLKQKLMERIKVHSSAETLLKYIPAEILPNDYGGNEPSLNQFQVLWREKLQEYGPRFDTLDLVRVNEKIRPSPLKNDDILGFYGNFKTLDVD